MSAAAIFRQLSSNGSIALGEVSESTVCRFVNLMSALKSAVAKYGRPKVLNFDNGKSYRNKQMELLAARIGTTLSYCQPYTPHREGLWSTRIFREPYVNRLSRHVVRDDGLLNCSYPNCNVNVTPTFSIVFCIKENGKNKDKNIRTLILLKK